MIQLRVGSGRKEMTEAPSEATRVAEAPKAGPAQQLIATLTMSGDGSFAALGKLTSEMIEESAGWGQRDAFGEKSAEVVRAWWLRQLAEEDEEYTTLVGENWEEAFRKVRAEPEAKPAEAEVSPELEAVIKYGGKPALERVNAARKLKLIRELVGVFLADDSIERAKYNSQKAEVAVQLGIHQMDVHRAVMNEVEKDKKKETKELPQSQKAVALMLDVANRRLWVDPQDGKEYASFRVDGHWENYRVGSGEFESRIRSEYGKVYFTENKGRRVPSPMTTEQVHHFVATMKAKAVDDGHKVTPSLRIGGGRKEVWLDLGRSDWQLVKVTAESWELFKVGVPGVAFIRRPGMLELPEPECCEDIHLLRDFLNVRKEDFVLQVGWLLGALRPRGPYPPNMITGPYDSAKTTTCKVLMNLVDPNFADLIPISTVIDNIYIDAYSRHLLAFDNISYITPEQADALCRISTGIGYSKRALRTDADQFMMKVCRPSLLNGIPDDLAERGDLASRSMVTELPSLSESLGLSEEEFEERFEAARGRILGALLHGVVGALKGASGVSLEGRGRIRMTDFVKWAEAGCRALGFRENEFLDAYILNLGRAMRIAFEHDLVARGVALMMGRRKEKWRGNTRALMTAVEAAVGKDVIESAMLTDKRWPKNDAWFGRKLRRAAGVLRKAAGIKVTFDVDLREAGEGEKGGVELERVEAFGGHGG
jgi:hypothetical protein